MIYIIIFLIVGLLLRPQMLEPTVAPPVRTFVHPALVNFKIWLLYLVKIEVWPVSRRTACFKPLSPLKPLKNPFIFQMGHAGAPTLLYSCWGRRPQHSGWPVGVISGQSVWPDTTDEPVQRSESVCVCIGSSQDCACTKAVVCVGDVLLLPIMEFAGKDISSWFDPETEDVRQFLGRSIRTASCNQIRSS